MKVHKAERLLNLIALLLETGHPLTAQAIRETVPGYDQESWDSFKRMFERDKDDLREMGIPLELAPTDIWETEEGYRIPKERYYLPDLRLEDDEVAALWLAAGLLRLQDPGAARTALLKLSGDLPPEAERSSLSWMTADLGLAVPGLDRAFEAVTVRKSVTFRYRGSGGRRSRTVDPYGLVHRRGSWYLVGRDHENGQVRSFRLDRMEAGLHIVDPGRPGSEYEVPEGFLPHAAIEAPPFVGEAQETAATVRFDAGTAWWVERTHPWLRLAWEEGGSAVATVAVSEPSGFVSWVLWFGDGAEVLGPPELRAAVRSRCEELCEVESDG